MNNIITKMKEEIIKRSNEFQNKTKGTKDEYNLYNEHIQYVFKYVNILSKNKWLDSKQEVIDDYYIQTLSIKKLD